MDDILQIKNLSKRYNSATVNAVDDVTFEVHSGELFCLLGVNGAGKSTTINIICTLLEKTAGDVKLCGLTLGKDDNTIRHKIGVVFQSNVLDNDLTIRENILLRSAFYNLNATQAKAKLAQLADQLSINNILDRRYEKLSGGQRRKCDIARALMASPSILFLDEPTTGLDPQSRVELWETINMLRKSNSMTVFLTTHYMEETESADRIAIINNGKVLCLDTPQKLKSAYSSDTLHLVAETGCSSDLEKIIPDFKLVADTYIINVANNLEAIEILNNVKHLLHSFEMKKGNMDMVFLNVVGRKPQ